MKHFGQTKERKQALTMGLRIVVTKSVKTLRMTGWGGWLCGGPGAGVGLAINTHFARFRKSCFRKDTSSKCMYFCKLPQICFRRNLEINRFRKLSQIWFCRVSLLLNFSKFSQLLLSQLSPKFRNFRLSQLLRKSKLLTFARFRTNIVLLCFASICKTTTTQAFPSHGFASFCKISQGFAKGLSQGFAKDSQVLKYGFSQGFTMGTLLRLSLPYRQSQASAGHCMLM